MTQLELRGQVVDVGGIEWGSAEPDVGIMNDYVESFKLFSASGEELDWSLSDEETEKVYDAIGPRDEGEYDDEGRWVEYKS